MLKALYDYGIRNHLTIPPGFLKKNIRAYICLSDSGRFLGIEQCGKEETQICPDIGSLANSPDKCQPLAQKESVVLGEPAKKSDYLPACAILSRPAVLIEIRSRTAALSPAEQRRYFLPANALMMFRMTWTELSISCTDANSHSPWKL